MDTICEGSALLVLSLLLLINFISIIIFCRSIAEWFDHDNGLVFEKFFRFFEQHHKETREKKDQ